MQCLASGMDDYISKPVDIRQLDDRIRTWIASSAEEACTRAANAAEPVPLQDRVLALPGPGLDSAGPAVVSAKGCGGKGKYSLGGARSDDVGANSRDRLYHLDLEVSRGRVGEDKKRFEGASDQEAGTVRWARGRLSYLDLAVSVTAGRGRDSVQGAEASCKCPGEDARGACGVDNAAAPSLPLPLPVLPAVVAADTPSTRRPLSPQKGAQPRDRPLDCGGSARPASILVVDGDTPHRRHYPRFSVSRSGGLPWSVVAAELCSRA